MNPAWAFFFVFAGTLRDLFSTLLIYRFRFVIRCVLNRKLRFLYSLIIGNILRQAYYVFRASPVRWTDVKSFYILYTFALQKIRIRSNSLKEKSIANQSTKWVRSNSFWRIKTIKYSKNPFKTKNYGRKDRGKQFKFFRLMIIMKLLAAMRHVCRIWNLSTCDLRLKIIFSLA